MNKFTITHHKDNETYFFVFADNNKDRAECLRTLGRWASNPELSFTWHDAAEVSKEIRTRNNWRR